MAFASEAMLLQVAFATHLTKLLLAIHAAAVAHIAMTLQISAITMNSGTPTAFQNVSKYLSAVYQPAIRKGTRLGTSQYKLS